MVNEYEDIIQLPEQFSDAYKPISPWRIGKWENVKPKPVLRKSVKQMVDEYDGLIIPPPEQFRDEYRPISKPRTDRPLQIRKNQNARRPPKPQRSPPPPPKKEHEDPVIPPLQFRDDKPLQEPDSITDKPSPKIQELNRALKGHAKSYEIEIQDSLNPLNHFTKAIGRISHLKDLLKIMKHWR